MDRTLMRLRDLFTKRGPVRTLATLWYFEIAVRARWPTGQMRSLLPLPRTRTTS